MMALSLRLTPGMLSSLKLAVTESAESSVVFAGEGDAVLLVGDSVGVAVGGLERGGLDGLGGGAVVGFAEGEAVLSVELGVGMGATDGRAECTVDGLGVGTTEGFAEGAVVGVGEGSAVGSAVGGLDGMSVGSDEGCGLGAVGIVVGYGVGSAVGIELGVAVGC